MSTPQIEFDDVLALYGQEIARLTQRALIAEAQVKEAVARIEELTAQMDAE